MLALRLSQAGKKGSNYYKIVATNTRSKRDGKPLEILGFWKKTKNEKKVNMERVNYWKSKGAKVSAVLANLLTK